MTCLTLNCDLPTPEHFPAPSETTIFTRRNCNLLSMNPLQTAQPDRVSDGNPAGPSHRRQGQPLDNARSGRSVSQSALPGCRIRTGSHNDILGWRKCTKRSMIFLCFITSLKAGESVARAANSQHTPRTSPLIHRRHPADACDDLPHHRLRLQDRCFLAPGRNQPRCLHKVLGRLVYQTISDWSGRILLLYKSDFLPKGPVAGVSLLFHATYHPAQCA